MSHFPAWAVAAGVMSIEGGLWHYDKLTRRVLKSGLSGLGSRGGSTPWQTLRVDIVENHGDIFERSLRRGYYKLRNEALALKKRDVRLVIECLLPTYLDEYRSLVQRCAVDHIYSRNPSPAKQQRVHELEAILHRVCGFQIDAAVT